MTTTVFLYDPNTATNHDITSEVYAVSTNRGKNRELDEINAGTAVVRCRNYLGNFNPYFINDNSFLLLEDGSYFLLEDGGRLILEGAGTGGDYGIMSIGRKLTVFDGATCVFTGFIEDIDLDWRSDKFKDATLHAADGLARFARQKFEGDWTTTAQATGARMSAVMNRPEVDDLWATLLFDTGLSTLQSDVVTHGTNVLNYLQLINRCEQGRLYVSGFGTLVFQDRQSVAVGTPVVDFDDDATGQVANEIPFSVIEVQFGSELLYTKVSVEIVGGDPQTANDLTAQSNKGIRHLVLSNMLNDTENEAADMAQYLLDRYSLEEAVVSAIRVPLDKLSSTNRTTVAGLEISDTVTLHWTPTASLGEVAQTLVIEGVGYEKDVHGATWMSFQLSAAPDNDFFILDNDSDNQSGASILDNDTDTQASAGLLGF
jgi:hypothetical protein